MDREKKKHLLMFIQLGGVGGCRGPPEILRYSFVFVLNCKKAYLALCVFMFC